MNVGECVYEWINNMYELIVLSVHVYVDAYVYW
jgi:uncharacterized alkaline shock family protein YloU